MEKNNRAVLFQGDTRISIRVCRGDNRQDLTCIIPHPSAVCQLHVREHSPIRRGGVLWFLCKTFLAPDAAAPLGWCNPPPLGTFFPGIWILGKCTSLGNAIASFDIVPLQLGV